MTHHKRKRRRGCRAGLSYHKDPTGRKRAQKEKDERKGAPVAE